VSLNVELGREGTLEQFPHILWKYGQAIETLRYSVGRESSLPCSKRFVRECLRLAIELVHDRSARKQLRAGYVQLEVFTTDAEFETVRALQDKLGEDATLLRSWLSPQRLKQITARTEAAEAPAMAILMRIAERMLARRRELWEDC